MVKTAMAGGNTESYTLARRPYSTFQRRGKMYCLINRFYRHESGATATEYAMLVVFIALAVAVGAQALGGGLSNLLTNIASTVTNVTIPSP
jgi:pilus assembly protein Flp/PilA